MYNFEEISSLSELKELCFYIKAINESGIKECPQSHIKIAEFLNEKYNLEIFVSKLYHFVKKIKKMFGSNTFPTDSDVDLIINAYINEMQGAMIEADQRVKECELTIYEPRYRTRKNDYQSTYDLSQDVSVNRTLYMHKNNSLLIWAFVWSLFIVTSAYCVVGIAFPTWLAGFVTKSQEIAIVLVCLIVLFVIFYAIMYIINRKQLVGWRDLIENYYKYEHNIKSDLKELNLARANLGLVKSKCSINGIQLSREMVYNYLTQSDELDIKFFASKNIKSTQNVKLDARFATTVVGQTISRYEQNKYWRESEIAQIEKENINKEIVARVDNLASNLKLMNFPEQEQIKTIGELYYEELSVSVRNKKIDGAQSRVELCKNFVDSVDRILQHQKLYALDLSKEQTLLKSVLLVSDQERKSFDDSVELMMNRIEKACELKLLPDGQINSFFNIKSEYQNGRFQGQEITAIRYRYDLAKLYIKIYDELLGYDLLT